MKFLLVFALLFTLTACGGGETPLPPTSIPGLQPASATSPASTPPPAGTPETPVPVGDDFFSRMGIELPAPTCNGTQTLSQTEGPYYTANTPKRNSLLEPGMTGQSLIVAGFVLDQNCQPIPNAWLDFWQADADGIYDNQGYILRGHQFADGQGRFYLETVVPGQYPGRTEHIHVKVQPPGGSVLTSQLYFPSSANQSDGIFDASLLMQIEDRGGFLLAFFNFVVNGN